MVFSIDAEEWFTNGRDITVDLWNNYEFRENMNTHKVLNLLDDANSKGHFLF